MVQAARASIPQDLSVQQAAAEIVALFNSRPTSPDIEDRDQSEVAVTYPVRVVADVARAQPKAAE
jgi:hypothetical protein